LRRDATLCGNAHRADGAKCEYVAKINRSYLAFVG
jgi:hypothetical protein